MIEITQAVKLAQAVATWTAEELKQILTLAEALKAAASTAPEKKKPGAKKDPNAPKRKYTKRAKPEAVPAPEVAGFEKAS